MPAVHVYPVDDLVGHVAPEDPGGDTGGWLCVEELPGEQFDDCPCGPLTEPVPGVNGSIGWLIIHHSLDNREMAEVGHA